MTDFIRPDPDPIDYYFVWGNVRGRIPGKFRKEDRAHLAAQKDRRACQRLGGGAYSDVKVYARYKSGLRSDPLPFPDHLLGVR